MKGNEEKRKRVKIRERVKGKCKRGEQMTTNKKCHCQATSSFHINSNCVSPPSTLPALSGAAAQLPLTAANCMGHKFDDNDERSGISSRSHSVKAQDHKHIPYTQDGEAT